MKILIVIDQFDDANNGTTISAKRFAVIKNARAKIVNLFIKYFIQKIISF